MALNWNDLRGVFLLSRWDERLFQQFQAYINIEIARDEIKMSPADL
jgi:hypothetical protein